MQIGYGDMARSLMMSRQNAATKAEMTRLSQEVTTGLAAAKAELQDATMWLMQNGLANPDNAGAASTDYLQLFGLTALAYMWALQAKAALARIAGGDTDPFYQTKLTLGRYYIERILPETSGRRLPQPLTSSRVVAMPAFSTSHCTTARARRFDRSML